MYGLLDFGGHPVLHAWLFPGLFGQAFQPMLFKCLFNVVEMLAGNTVDFAGLRNVVEVFGQFQ